MILFKDCISWIKKSDLSRFNLIFLDAPFNEELEERTLRLLTNNKSLKPSCKIYLEHSKFSIIEIPTSLKILKEKNVGDVKALLLSNEN
jgi:16S rRNA (guanine966-N2)-methyltransferase